MNNTHNLMHKHSMMSFIIKVIRVGTRFIESYFQIRLVLFIIAPQFTSVAKSQACCRANWCHNPVAQTYFFSINKNW